MNPNDPLDPTAPLPGDEPGILPDFDNDAALPPEPEEEKKHELPEEAKQKIEEYKKEQIEKVKAKLRGQKKAGKGTGAEEAVEAEGAGEEAAEQGAKKAVKKGAKQAAKGTGELAEGGEAAAAGAEAAAAAEVAGATAAGVAEGGAAVATVEIWGPILIIVAIIVIIIIVIGVVIALFALQHGSGGSGPPTYPQTAADRQQVSALGALTQNQLANTELVQKTVALDKARFSAIKTTINKVYSSDSGKAAAATSDLNAIITAMDSVVTAPTLAQKNTLIAQIQTQLQSFYVKYPEIVGTGAVNGGALPVPGVNERADQPHSCGISSALMIVLYYNPAYTNPSLYDKAAHATATNKTACIGAYDQFFNSNTPHSDWATLTFNAVPEKAVVNSLAGGDPVMLYTAPGGVYSTNHIVDIVGYRPSDDTFIINSPRGAGAGVDLHTPTPHGKQMTWSRIRQFAGDSFYHHTFVIRKAYVK